VAFTLWVALAPHHVVIGHGWFLILQTIFMTN
jgi:hypothetical protein